MARWRLTSLMLVAIAAITAVVAIGLTTRALPAGAAGLFNSSEPGCDGTDPSVVFCDDFERGTWAYTYFSDADSRNAGWLMSVYPPAGCGSQGCGSGQPLAVYDAAAAQYARCGGQGAAGTNCTADTGPHGAGPGQAYGMGQVVLKNVNTGSASSGYQEVYIRFYYKSSTNYTYNAQKFIAVQPATQDAGIFIGNISFPFSDGELHGAPIYDINTSFANPLCRSRCPNGVYLNQNAGPGGSVFSFLNYRGRWIFVEAHIKLNTPGVRNGIYELWLADCGINGLTCPAAPVKYASYNNVMWLGPTVTGQPGSADFKIGRLFHENWANPGPGPGTAGNPTFEQYDQYKIATVGPIGFMGSGSAADRTAPAPPAAPVFR